MGVDYPAIKKHSPVGVDFPENGENVYEIDKRGAPCKRSGDRFSGGGGVV